MIQIIYSRSCLLFFSMIFLFGLPGCVATRQWVSDQLAPLAGRVSDGETRVNEVGGRVSGLESSLGQTDAKLGETGARLSQTDAKAERALRDLANLRLERRFVLDLKEGANFAFNSAALAGETRREIDGFFSDLRGELSENGRMILLIAGHTDNVGSDNYNYELGKKRAESVARYLIVQKKMDPLRVMTVSYGKSAPLADNRTREGRGKNRRVEILVYSEGITTTSASDQGAAGTRSQDSEGRMSAR